jgi:uncharacterized protein (DUF849 family)
VLQAALNGARSPEEHPALPLTPAQLAADARAAIAAGARSVHAHVRRADGSESLAPHDVAAVVTAVTGVELSLSTGLWITGDVERRQALVAAWTALPDLVSLNVSEPGWEELAALLAERGIGVEAGLATVGDAEALLSSPLRPARVLVEIDDETLAGDEAVGRAAAIDQLLDAAGHSAPRLHHGMGRATWAVMDAAVARGHDIRVGLEDVLVLPDGSPAAGNEALVAVAAARYAARGRLST